MAMYSLGIRIYHHGITITRYYGIIIISLEIIFFILSLKRNHKYLHNLLLFSAILVLISMTIPYINCVSVSRTSQLNRLTSIYKENTIYDNLSNEEIEMLEDFIVLASKDAITKIDKEFNSKMGQYSGMLNGLI